MAVLYTDDYGRNLGVNTFSQHVRRVVVIDKNGNKYTGFIDAYKNGWGKSNHDGAGVNNNSMEPLIGPGPGVLDCDEIEDGMKVVHVRMYYADENEFHWVNIDEIFNDDLSKLLEQKAYYAGQSNVIDTSNTRFIYSELDNREEDVRFGLGDLEVELLSDANDDSIGKGQEHSSGGGSGDIPVDSVF